MFRVFCSICSHKIRYSFPVACLFACPVATLRNPAGGPRAAPINAVPVVSSGRFISFEPTKSSWGCGQPLPVSHWLNCLHLPGFNAFLLSAFMVLPFPNQYLTFLRIEIAQGAGRACTRPLPEGVARPLTGLRPGDRTADLNLAPAWWGWGATDCGAGIRSQADLPLRASAAAATSLIGAWCLNKPLAGPALDPAEPWAHGRARPGACVCLAASGYACRREWPRSRSQGSGVCGRRL